MAKTVLVADDEWHILDIVSMKLSNAGYEVVKALDGVEAFELATTAPPCLIITDFQMPHMSGVELCRKLSETGSTRSIPIIMLTARGFDIEPHEVQATNVVDVMAKPFSPRELLKKVHDLVGDP